MRQLSFGNSVAACLVVLLASLVVSAHAGVDSQTASDDALHRLEASGAQIFRRNEKDGSGTLVISTDGSWHGGDAELRYLSQVDGLYKLRLGGGITDAGLTHLNAVSGLTELDVHVVQVTDQGVRQLESLTNLRRLNLTYTKVSDDGLKSLRGLTKLKWLGLSFTNVSAAGVRELKAYLPNTIIEGNFNH